MVFDVFGSLRSIAKLDSVCIDNNVFRLHYKVTVIFLFASSLLVSSSQYFGDPIDCIQNDDIPENVIDTYCWIHATFVLPSAFDKKIGVDVPHSGVDHTKPGEQRVYQKYYQWVCFVLFLQAILFYTPRYLWKLWEGKAAALSSLALNALEDAFRMLSDLSERRSIEPNSTLFVPPLTRPKNQVAVFVVWFAISAVRCWTKTGAKTR